MMQQELIPKLPVQRGVVIELQQRVIRRTSVLSLSLFLCPRCPELKERERRREGCTEETSLFALLLLVSSSQSQQPFFHVLSTFFVFLP